MAHGLELDLYRFGMVVLDAKVVQVVHINNFHKIGTTWYLKWPDTHYKQVRRWE
jgi:hypothetical protein